MTRVCHLARPAARPHPAARLTPRPGPGDYATTDEQTVADLHAAVGRFFELHPRLAANEFYLSGAPRLARTAAAEAPARAAMLRGGRGARCPRAQRRRRARAGESYAGVYVPLVAQAVLKGNAAPDALFKVNLKVGRPRARQPGRAWRPGSPHAR